MRSKKLTHFQTKRSLRACEDIVRYPQAVTDQRTLEAVKGFLTPGEREDMDFLGGIISGGKLILICKDPEALRDVILIERKNPKTSYRRRLVLKREDDPAEV